MYNYFSHAETAHKTNTETLEHLFKVWYSGIPLYLLLLVLLGYIVYKITKGSFAKTYVFISGILLISGVLLYDYSPAVSALGITFGFFSSIMVVYIGLKK